MKTYIFIGILILSLIAVIIFIQHTGLQCSEDSDCAPQDCYHSKSCIPKEAAPNCTGILGTQECVPDTLDCGQGSCACEKEMCKVKWSK